MSENEEGCLSGCLGSTGEMIKGLLGLGGLILVPLAILALICQSSYGVPTRVVIATPTATPAPTATPGGAAVPMTARNALTSVCGMAALFGLLLVIILLPVLKAV